MYSLDNQGQIITICLDATNTLIVVLLLIYFNNTL